MQREKAYRILRSRGLRITPLKRQVVELFLQGECGLSAGGISATLTSATSFSSVYRCIQSLQRAGFLRRMNGPSGVVQYRCTPEFFPDHGHFRCRACGSLTPVNDLLPGVFIDAIEKKYGVSVQFTDFHLEGRCSFCIERH